MVASAAEVPIPPKPDDYVTDTAGFLSPATISSLDARLQRYNDQTGHQVLVYVAATTGTTPTEDWTVKAFENWKPGRKGVDDGLVLFVLATDHKVRIEVGYGLESNVPDATVARIIRDTILPKIRAGQPGAPGANARAVRFDGGRYEHDRRRYRGRAKDRKAVHFLHRSEPSRICRRR